MQTWTSRSPSFSADHVVTIDANRTVKDSLLASLDSSRPRRRISVTDLVNPSQAYYQRTRPDIRPSLDRRQLMMAGTGFHDVFGRAVSTEEYVEQLLEYEGIVGKVDIYEDVPVEVKTTGFIPDDLYKSRGSYFDQLGMYCVMAGERRGHLVVYRRQASWFDPQLRVYGVDFLDPDGIGAEMVRRRDLLADALDRQDPSGLPKCEWSGRGCDYSEVCACADATPGGRVVGRRDIEYAESRDIAARLVEQLSVVPAHEPRLRLNDLVFPRKAALRRVQSAQGGGVADWDPEDRMRDMQSRGFWEALGESLRYGAPGEFQLVPVQLGSIRDRVQVYREAPTILRTTRRSEMVERRDLAAAFPYYFDRMGFECAVAGSSQARLLLYYEAIKGDKFMVYDVRFRGVDEVRAEALRRLELLESEAPHTELPACPSWMSRYCDFAPGCACG